VSSAAGLGESAAECHHSVDFNYVFQR